MDIPAEVLTVLPGQPCHDSKLTGEHVSAMIQLACWNPPENGDLITQTGLPSLGFMEAGSRKDYLVCACKFVLHFVLLTNLIEGFRHRDIEKDVGHSGPCS
jgi:hypothetical protein